MIELIDLCVKHNATLRDALVSMDKNAQGIVFVCENQKLVGVLTDGDIRRALIDNFTLNESVKSIYKSNYVSLHFKSTVEHIQSKLSSRYKIIPLLDDNGCIVDYSSIYRTHRIPVLEPLLGGNELNYVTECIKTNWISSQGKFVRQFEDSLAKQAGVKHAVAVSNGTVALHLALMALGISSGDEVIVPDFTFAASVNAIIHANATPVLIDVDPTTWTLDPKLIEEAITEKTKAIMPVHLYGHPCDMDEIIRIADKYDLLIIEDCAEALGSSYKGKPVGGFGDAATYSFFGNKVITCGEGGMVLFRDVSVYGKAMQLRDHGMNKDKRYWHDVIGYNYRMTNLQAAVGVAQMEQFDKFRARRSEIYGLYNKLLKDNEFLAFQSLQEWAESSYWLYTLELSDKSPFSRDELIEKLGKNGIEARPTFYSMHMMPPYQGYVSVAGYPSSEKISKNGISLPSSVSLADTDIREICKKINGFFSNRKIISIA